MKRRTHIFLVAVDEDPIPGSMDGDNIEQDVRDIIGRAVSAYNPKTIKLGTVIRESNFLGTVDHHLDVSVVDMEPDDGDMVFSGDIVIHYEPERVE